MDSAAGSLVLIVEDDSLIARLIAMMLKAYGYQTRIASSAEAAISDLPECAPALLTLALNLPGMSGTSLLQQLREMPQYAALPVIIITAQYQIPQKARALANVVLFKPFGLDELITAVQATMTAFSHPRGRVVGGSLSANITPAPAAHP